MKHADRVIELMGAYPGRGFKMREIVRYVHPTAGLAERQTIKKAVQRALLALELTGVIAVQRPKASGSCALFIWKSGT